MWPSVINPDFHLSRPEIAAERARMSAAPKPLTRPVVVLAGWRSPSFTARILARSLERLTSQRSSDFLVISYSLESNFDAIVRRVQHQVAHTFPPTSPHHSLPIDVITISMGGLVARAAALPSPNAPHLSIARLFTIATPHRGARLARYIRPDHAAAVMRRGSSELSRLDAALDARDFQLFCYAQLRDWWIGTTAATPPGHDPRWVDVRGPIGAAFSHFLVNRNPLVTLDIARHLRAEEPLARRATPLPSF